MPIVPFIPAIVGGASSIIGGIQGRNAAKNAAAAQQQAAADAAAKINATVNEVNPQITAAHQAAEGAAITAAGNSAATVNGAADRANGLMDPYRDTGGQANTTIGEALKPGGDFNRQFGMNDFENLDPGYQFRLDQASKALDKSAAARGVSLSGGQLKALQTNSQGLASSEFQNAFQRFETSNNDRFARLNTVAGRGFDASGQEGRNLTDAGRYSGDITYQGQRDANGYLISGVDKTTGNTLHGAELANQYSLGGADAKAAGDIAAANSWNGALKGVASAATTAADVATGKDKLPWYGMKPTANATPSPGTVAGTGYATLKPTRR